MPPGFEYTAQVLLETLTLFVLLVGLFGLDPSAQFGGETQHHLKGAGTIIVIAVWKIT